MPHEASQECYSFASFRLYPKQRTLLRGTDLVTIGGRAFDMLLFLVSQAGVVISLNTLMASVWPDVTVEEANLRVQMGMLRKILAQCQDAQRAVETIPLRGYCFILPVDYHPEGVGVVNLKLHARATLPSLLDPAVGRDDAIATISNALAERRLVTITGPGGIGKTTVAVATAEIHARSNRGEVIFVDLSSATDGPGAALLVAAALDVDVSGDAVTALCEHLSRRDLLLVLDTCEHIVESIAALAEFLLTHCAGLRLLVTSREALRATGEWTHRLPSLKFPESNEEVDESNWTGFSALVLFVDRMRASTRFDVQVADLPILAEICRRLDGIALALEFAAARVADLGLREIAAHLDDRFKILTRGRRTALPRHQTLWAAFEWSHSLLPDDERAMLHHVAQFDGPFTTEHAAIGSAKAGCTRPEAALCSLYDKSLLAVDLHNGTPLYRLLQTTKAYVRGAAVDRAADQLPAAQSQARRS